MAKPLPVITPNMTWLTESLAVGGDLSYSRSEARQQADKIVDAGVTHIFDARIEADDTHIWEPRGIEYLRVGVNDAWGTHLPALFFDHAVELAREAALAGGKIFAHCHMGINRGPSAAAAILMDRGMPPIEALKLIVRLRPIAGVYYFMDAYDADMSRKGIVPSKAMRRYVDAQWRAIVRNPDHIAHVNRAIMDNNVAALEKREARLVSRNVGVGR